MGCTDRGASVEQLLHEALAAPVAVTTVVATWRVGIPAAVAAGGVRVAARRVGVPARRWTALVGLRRTALVRRRRGLCRVLALGVQDGLQLTAVEEDPAAAVALVDVDALAVH